MTTRAGLAALLLLAAGVAGCGDEPPKASNDPTPVRVTKSVTFTQVLLAYARGDRPPVTVPRRRDGKVEVEPVTRTKEEALRLAQSLLGRIRAGESMERIVSEATDDRSEDGRPFNDGTYTKAPFDPTHPELRRVVFSLKVGELHPVPVDVDDAYLLVRRDL